MNESFKKQITSAAVAFIIFCSSTIIYALVDLNQRQADEERHNIACPSCALMVEKTRQRQAVVIK